ncbi:MAG: helix-turn-helix transcriptional regulator [Roseivirga sp.]|nr:helix-turn-helix transcriptional regulator [Roseivirga sp.]
MRVVPEAFFQNTRIRKIMVDGQCCIIHKETGQQDLDNHRLLAAHALTVVRKGGLMVHTDEGIPSRVSRGQMVLMPKGLYAITDLIPENDVFEAVVLFFDDKLARQYLQKRGLADIEVQSDRRPTRFTTNDYFETYIDQLLSLYGKVEADPSLVSIKLLEALYLIDSKDPSGQFTQKVHELMAKPNKQLKRFMQDHFDKPLDVEDYAALSGRSLSTFRREFHKQFGYAPKQWLIQQRMEKAKGLLEEDKMSVSLVAEESGYLDLPHFIKSFQKHFALSPKQYALSKRN